MKKIISLSFFILSAALVKAQGYTIKDTISFGSIIVSKDNRLEILTRKEAEFNEAIANGPKVAHGYRLMVLSTSDRAEAMNVRAQLLQHYPEQRVYMSFQPPYIKLKFGNFLDKSEADEYRKEFVRDKLVSSNIYIIPENIEIKGEKLKEYMEKEKEVQ